MPNEIATVTVEDVTAALSQIKEQHNIEDDRFVRGYSFVRGILDGLTANASYSEAFDVSMNQAKNVSSQLYRRKWIQAIFEELEVEVEVRDRDYIEEAKETLSAVMATSRDEKNLIAAAGAMIRGVKDSRKEKKETETLDESKLSEILNMMKSAASDGKMLSPTSGVIDVVVINE